MEKINVAELKELMALPYKLKLGSREVEVMPLDVEQLAKVGLMIIENWCLKIHLAYYHAGNFFGNQL